MAPFGQINACGGSRKDQKVGQKVRTVRQNVRIGTKNYSLDHVLLLV